jgi:hypothetical protein
MAIAMYSLQAMLSLTVFLVLLALFENFTLILYPIYYRWPAYHPALHGY